jgi:hypothetical protein
MLGERRNIMGNSEQIGIESDGSFVVVSTPPAPTDSFLKRETPVWFYDCKVNALRMGIVESAPQWPWEGMIDSDTGEPELCPLEEAWYDVNTGGREVRSMQRSGLIDASDDYVVRTLAKAEAA